MLIFEYMTAKEPELY